eukprot:2525668-Prymnesium_polylepis.1
MATAGVDLRRVCGQGGREGEAAHGGRPIHRGGPGAAGETPDCLMVNEEQMKKILNYITLGKEQGATMQ